MASLPLGGNEEGHGFIRGEMNLKPAGLICIWVSKWLEPPRPWRSIPRARVPISCLIVRVMFGSGVQPKCLIIVLSAIHIIEDEWVEEYLNRANVRVLRGGSWFSLGQDFARCACRDQNDPGYRISRGGCRVVVSPIF